MPGRSARPVPIPRCELEAVDQERHRLLSTGLDGLFDVGVHELGERRGVDGVLVERIQITKYPAEHGPDGVGRQPRNAIAVEAAAAPRSTCPPRRSPNQVQTPRQPSTSSPSAHNKNLPPTAAATEQLLTLPRQGCQRRPPPLHHHRHVLLVLLPYLLSSNRPPRRPLGAARASELTQHPSRPSSPATTTSNLTTRPPRPTHQGPPTTQHHLINPS